jgi:hypothetical protein
VQALRVVDVQEAIEALLLRVQVLRGRLGGFLLHSQVHALMAAVLLRTCRLGALDVDP